MLFVRIVQLAFLIIWLYDTLNVSTSVIVCTVRTKKTFTLRAKCTRTSIELGAIFTLNGMMKEANFYAISIVLRSNYIRNGIEIKR